MSQSMYVNDHGESVGCVWDHGVSSRLSIR